MHFEVFPDTQNFLRKLNGEFQEHSLLGASEEPGMSVTNHVYPSSQALGECGLMSVDASFVDEERGWE